MSDLWHSLRAENIGGSEVADLFGEGFNSYFHLWHVKSGNIEPEDLSQNEWVQSGNFLEPAIIKWAEWKFNLRYENPKSYFKHPEVRGMACTPDGINPDNPDDMCQIKNIDSIIFGRNWECDGDIITSAPMKYILQCQHEMACAEKRSSELLVLVGGKTLKRMTIYRDEELIEIIIKAVKLFWASIERGDEPDPDFSVDGPVVQKLRDKEIVVEDPIDWSQNNRMREVAENYLDAAEKEKAAKTAKEIAKTEIMHNATGGKKFLFGDRPGDPRITIVDGKSSSYPKVTRAKGAYQ